MTATQISLVIAIISFLAVLQPFYDAWAKKEKFILKLHAFKIILGFFGLIASISYIIVTSNSSKPVEYIPLSEPKEPLIELAPTGSYVLTEKKDTIDYSFNFINSGNGNAKTFKITITPVAIVNSPKSALVGLTQTINLNGLAAGATRSIDSYVFMKGKPDSFYFYMKGEYNNKPMEYLVRWYPGLELIKTMGEDRIKYISTLIYKWHKQ